MFSQMTMPMSTTVPMAMAMPERATTLASTPNSFIMMNALSTVSGSRLEISSELRKCIAMTSTTMMVIRISSRRANLSVPSVSWINPVRS
ncbi:MAG: hypothetical protein BWZ10_01533 [candidate division BRC1 bacterium ADurb.BinA364]|nr:MAG: hypothetical protein BWZ10_01533 [candidate division BRC1 bacterium ADurb.BinA364]